MKNIYLICFLLFTSLTYAQIGVGSNYVRQESNLRIGGSVGMYFGNGSEFGLNISPSIGYRLLPNLEAGVTAGYQFSKNKDSEFINTKQHLFSGGPYLNYYPIRNIFLRAHYEYFTGTSRHKINSNHFPSDPVFDSNIYADFSENAFWVGGGFRTGGRVQFYAGVVYNLLYKRFESGFSDAYQPIMGVNVGL